MTGGRWGRVARSAAGVAILLALVWRVGAAPFLDALHRLDVVSVAVAVGIGIVTTLAAGYRWQVVAQRLGVNIGLRRAVGAYYRSQFLNVTLPGGVAGDVERGIRQGRHGGDLAGGVRSVVWERVAGQSIQLTVTLAVLLAAPSPIRPAMPWVASALALLALVVGCCAVARRRERGARPRRLLEAAIRDVRTGLLARGAWPRVLAASVVVLAGHLAVFLVATRAAGSTASAATVLPLALVVLGAAALPTNIAGWGPREGAAAAVFAGGGLGAGTGLAASAAYGVLVLVAALPGAVLLLAGRLTRSRHGAPDGLPARALGGGRGAVPDG